MKTKNKTSIIHQSINPSSVSIIPLLFLINLVIPVSIPPVFFPRSQPI